MNYFIELWPHIVGLVMATFLISSMDSRISATTQRVDKLESIRDDIIHIKLKVERIDERLENIKRK